MPPEGAVLEGSPPAAIVEATPGGEGAPAADEVQWASDPRYAPKETPPAAPSPEASPAAPAPAAKADEGADASKPATPAAVEIPSDWKAKLEANDPDFLADFENHPKVKSFIAGRADFLRKQEAAQAEAVRLEAERTRLRKEDPEAYAALDEQLAQQKAAAQQTDDVVKTALTNSLGAAYVMLSKTLPKEAMAEYDTEIAGKDITLDAYVQKVVELDRKHSLPALKAKWAEEELPALFKDYLAKKGESEPSPDLGTGQPASGLSWDSYLNMTPEARRKLAATPAGKAQINALTSSIPSLAN